MCIRDSILVGLMVLVAALWFFLSPAPAEALSRGAMNEQWSFPAVIVREESVKLADSCLLYTSRCV